MFLVYILYSHSADSYYIGSSVDITSRLDRHNAGEVKSTKAFRPWVLVRQELFETRTEARKRELQIKRYKGGNAFLRLIHGQVPKRSNGADCKSAGSRLPRFDS